jgi:transglutaminase-like putative cysteine protease
MVKYRHMPIKIMLLLSAFWLPQKALAQEHFNTGYNVTYKVQEDGVVEVTQDISITNNRNDVVATDYTLTINKMKIYDVEGSDDEGQLDIKVDEDKNYTKISTQFNEQVVGEGRTLTWTLKYKTKDIASKVGEIWNINIPKVEVLDSTAQYNITLVVPNNFGPEIYIAPQPDIKTEELDTKVLKFNKITLQKGGITASYGNSQTLNFRLKYSLQNNSVFGSYQEIALPPTIEDIQQVKIETLSPAPKQIYTDQDGNLMAIYYVKGNSIVDIQTTGAVKIFGKQINPDFGGSFNQVPPSLLKYTKSKKYWEKDSDAIQKIAKELKSTEDTVSENAQRVYEYVVNKLDYNFGVEQNISIERHGALSAILDPGPWACMEFTDLFIAVSRAMGIPTRELNGYALTRESDLNPLSINLKSGDLLHSWAEFYDPNFGWVQVDPTWGNTAQVDYFTKLDTNHFVFVTKGLDSEYPFPAGTYKTEGTQKQVEVDVAQDPKTERFKEALTFYEVAKWNVFSKFLGKKTYLITETQGQYINKIEGKVDLLPFSSKRISVSKDAKTVSFKDFNNEEKEIQIVVSTEKPVKPISQKTNLKLYLSALLGLLLCGMFYVQLIHPGLLKKLFARLFLRLQGPSR